jgi:hypothetical protein
LAQWNPEHVLENENLVALPKKTKGNLVALRFDGGWRGEIEKALQGQYIMEKIE